MNNLINGNTLRDAYISGANNITNNKQRIDQLNVFPVPDGDTGTNMSMTINNCLIELNRLKDVGVDEVSKTAAAAFLRGARGNSGVILSLLFRGISKGLAEHKECDGYTFVEALGKGVDAAYKAVMKPTEGTILTVARLAYENTKDKATEDFAETFNYILENAKQALEQTPDMLPVLKKAGVVDAGGAGLIAVLEGMQSVFVNNVIVASESGPTVKVEKKSESNAAADAEFDESVLTYPYCTEFIVNKDKDANKDPKILRAYLESIGDCAVVVDDEDIIKVHVHTDHPGKAIEKGIEFGMLVNMKIENMKDQHERAKHDNQQETVQTEQTSFEPVKPENEFGFVSVCVGEGIESLFNDLGVDNLVSGGQTMNPSTDDILKAIELTPAKTVFVLPNNKNIIMAAEMAIPLATRNVIVLHTKTIPMGISAMLAFDPDLTADENTVAMREESEKVSTGQITFAARNSDFEGFKIKQGDIMAMENGKLSFIDQDIMSATVKLTKNMCNKNSSFVTVIYGEDISDAEAEELQIKLESKLGKDIEITMINGGQPVYYYIISVE